MGLSNLFKNFCGRAKEHEYLGKISRALCVCVLEDSGSCSFREISVSFKFKTMKIVWYNYGKIG